ncbi:MAG: ribosome maturation factor RimP [Proteobacteria bacterium]|nr:ribosome maturation factor RimP [Pseudomonadota bacterium]MBU1743181.1 ribosome maturation factor RimP [Pseudomonadota bacterium]
MTETAQPEPDAEPGRADLVAERAVRPMIEDLGYTLLDVEYKPGGARGVLKLVVDRPGGLSVDDCAAISRRAGDLIDVYLDLAGPYHLEVTSPGLTRALRRPAEFAHFAGRRVKVVCPGFEVPGGVVIGRLEGLVGEDVAVEVDGEQVLVPGDQTKRVRLCPEGFE